MAKLFKFSALFILIVFSVISCRKYADVDSSEITKPGTGIFPTYDRSNPTPTGVSVVNGTLVFQNLRSFETAQQFVSNASDTAIMAWQDGLGFKSIRYNYIKALSELCCPDDDSNNADVIAATYQGKVKYDSAEKDIEQLLPVGLGGWLANEAGEFKVGNSLVKYTETHVISVFDGDRSKLALALNSLQPDSIVGFDVHPIFVNALPENVCCPNTLNAPSVNNGNSSGSRRIKSAFIQVRNLSTIFSIDEGNGQLQVGSVWYTVAMDMHYQRRTFFGWTVCQRTKWKYKGSTTLFFTNTNFPPTQLPPLFTNPIVYNVDVAESGLECKHRNERTVLLFSPFSKTVFNALQGHCILNQSIDVEALETGLKTSNKCN